MKWRKYGQIFVPPGEREWMTTHAALPATDSISLDTVRVYFCGRNPQNTAQIGAFDLSLAGDPAVQNVTGDPLVQVGPLGAFDDRGVTMSCVVEDDGTKYLYYTGWSLGVTVPFYYSIGLATSEDAGQTFRKHSGAPVYGRSATDPFLSASPSILVENGVWKMWYVSGVRWEPGPNQPRHYYHIKYAESDDGITWKPTGIVCVDFKDHDEYAIGRPCVIRHEGVYLMWFCVRGERYRIGFAESVDGKAWQRCDFRAGIDVSESGWDSEELAYPWVFELQGRLYMLYNGNGYGRTGIGLAVQE